MPLGYYLSPEMNFIISLVSIGDRLVQLQTKEMRKAQLYADLTLVNLNLPARVYLPVLLSPDAPQVCVCVCACVCVCVLPCVCACGLCVCGTGATRVLVG